MDTRSVLIGTATGSALMFMLGPHGGGRRRALVRDQMVRASRQTRDGLDATARDPAHRATGIAAATRSRWTDEPASDETLIERVRAKLGRASSHPRAIDVHVAEQLGSGDQGHGQCRVTGGGRAVSATRGSDRGHWSADDALM